MHCYAMLFLFLFSHLEEVVFACGCEIRWLQLWQQRGEAGLSNQQLYCADGYKKILLLDMNISSCGKFGVKNSTQILCDQILCGILTAANDLLIMR